MTLQIPCWRSLHLYRFPPTGETGERDVARTPSEPQRASAVSLPTILPILSARGRGRRDSGQNSSLRRDKAARACSPASPAFSRRTNLHYELSLLFLSVYLFLYHTVHLHTNAVSSATFSRCTSPPAYYLLLPSYSHLLDYLLPATLLCRMAHWV